MSFRAKRRISSTSTLCVTEILPPFGRLDDTLCGLFQTIQTHSYRILVSIQLLVSSHDFDGRTNVLNTLAIDFLEGNLADEAIEAHTALGLGIAIGRQGMIGARCIVARTFRSVRTEED